MRWGRRHELVKVADVISRRHDVAVLLMMCSKSRVAPGSSSRLIPVVSSLPAFCAWLNLRPRHSCNWKRTVLFFRSVFFSFSDRNSRYTACKKCNGTRFCNFEIVRRLRSQKSDIYSVRVCILEKDFALVQPCSVAQGLVTMIVVCQCLFIILVTTAVFLTGG